MICPVAETLPSYGAARSPGQTTYAYDALGRQTLRVVSTPNDPELGSISDTWTYDEANGGQTRYGLLTSEQRTQGMLQFNGNDLVPFETDTWHKLYAYDEALRPAGYTTTIHPHSYGNQGNAPLINASTYTVSMAYDSYFGRVKSVTYPQSGVGEYTRYTIDGFVLEQGHSNDYANPAFWHRIEAMTASGQVKRELYGNGVVQEYTHDARTQQMTATQILASDAALSQLHSYQHDLFGNLIQQTRTATTYSTEDFQYDHQHRLRNSTRSGAANGGSIDYSYDELGNLLSKSDYGSNYQYGASVSISGCYTTPVSLPGPHAVSRVMAANNGGSYEYGYDANGNLICSSNSHNGPMQIHYDPTNKPFRVQRGSHQTEFWYGSDDQRYFQRDNSAGDTIYIGKLFEQKSNGQKKYYLGNYAVFTADISAGDSISYLHTDRLGSIIAISDENGNNTSNTGRGFDPFGKPREEDWDDVSPFAEGDLNGYETTTRGFTGHEHLNGTDLIHMNGRAYDYNLGRFLSVDPVIQFPANSQSLNPYSYIMNNPMAGTDPSGYTIAGAGAGAIKSLCEEKPSECKAKKETTGSTTARCKSGSACTVTQLNSGGKSGKGGSTNLGKVVDALNGVLERAANDDAISSKNQEQGIQLTRGDISDEALGLVRTHGGTFESRSVALAMFAEALKTTPGAIQSSFFAAASIVAGSFGSLDSTLSAFAANINAETLGFLRGLSREIFTFAAEIFTRLRDGQELPGAEGLTGASLDSALLNFEQRTVSQGFLNRTNPIGSSSRTRLINEINDLFDGGAAFIRRRVVPFTIDDRFERAATRAQKQGFNFESPPDRIALGEDILSQIREN